ncbi:hypothetical protein BLNAU_23513 [Blattamonas nauphoetae]|uniref:Uncharacterized protein n=1 Tax=Blattamonas nauphoetae TaxID=2049346 RepID=A0ABQ9WQ17_9EUKA|nr:hypothetical protein BLNAU_23513 [Blattamonas nauphoetae]
MTTQPSKCWNWSPTDSKGAKPELSFDKVFEYTPPKTDPEELQKGGRSKTFAFAALLTFVEDGYVKSRQDTPYQPIIVEDINFEKKLTGTHTCRM